MVMALALAHHVPEATDFWGVVAPAWFGAIGTVASAALGMIALFLTRTNRKGLRTLATEANATAQTTTVEPTETDASGNLSAEATITGEASINTDGTLTVDGEVVRPAIWEVQRSTPGSDHWWILNRTNHAFYVTDVDKADRNDASITHIRVPVQLPALIRPNERLPIILRRNLGSSPVSLVKVVWLPEGKSTHLSTMVLFF